MLYVVRSSESESQTVRRCSKFVCRMLGIEILSGSEIEEERRRRRNECVCVVVVDGISGK